MLHVLIPIGDIIQQMEHMHLVIVNRQISSDKNAEVITNKLVTISELRSPIYLPKKPEMIDARSGRNKSEISILTF